MASIDKLKGRYFFGVDQATSIVAQAGNPGGDLIPLSAVGVPVYYSNYVELKQGNRFRTPFNSTPRNRTIIIACVMPFYEMGYDSGTNRFPPVTLPAMALARSSIIAAWATDGYITTTGNNLLVSLVGGSSQTNVVGASNTAIAYRDGTFNWQPGFIIIGQGADGTGTYCAATLGRNLQWEPNNTAYTGSGSPPTPTVFGNCTYNGGAGSTATDHMMLLGYAEYSYLNKAEALEAATEMATLLQARGWVNTFNIPQRANITADVGGVGETVVPTSPQPNIVASNANFTVTDSPTNAGWKRITKVGGTNGTLELAAVSDAALARHWMTNIKDPLEVAEFRAGYVPQAIPGQTLTGWASNGPGGAFVVHIKGVYGGSNTAHGTGKIVSIARAASTFGYPGFFAGTDKIGGPLIASDTTQGTTDAGTPLLFACELKTIGQYIDVKIA